MENITISIKENSKRIYVNRRMFDVHLSQQKPKRTRRDSLYINRLHMAITGLAEYLKTRQRIENPIDGQ